MVQQQYNTQKWQCTRVLPQAVHFPSQELLYQLAQGRQLLVLHQVKVLRRRRQQQAAAGEWKWVLGGMGKAATYKLCALRKVTVLLTHPCTHLDEDDEVLEAGVEVRLLTQATDLLEVAVVDVRIHPEQPLEHGAHHVHEVGREGLPKLAREHRGVVDLHTAAAATVGTRAERMASAEQFDQCMSATLTAANLVAKAT